MWVCVSLWLCACVYVSVYCVWGCACLLIYQGRQTKDLTRPVSTSFLAARYDVTRTYCRYLEKMLNFFTLLYHVVLTKMRARSLFTHNPQVNKKNWLLRHGLHHSLEIHALWCTYWNLQCQSQCQLYCATRVCPIFLRPLWLELDRMNVLVGAWTKMVLNVWHDVILLWLRVTIKKNAVGMIYLKGFAVCFNLNIADVIC